MGAARKLTQQLDLFAAPPPRQWRLPKERGIEPLGRKVWRGLSLVLWQRLATPMQWPDLYLWAERVRWSAERVQNALAVLEGDGRAEAVVVNDVVVWRRREDG